MGDLLIDPPVTPFSPVDELEEWLASLRDRRDEHEQGTAERSSLEQAIDEAEEMLEQARGRA